MSGRFVFTCLFALFVNTQGVCDSILGQKQKLLIECMPARGLTLIVCLSGRCSSVHEISLAGAGVAAPGTANGSLARESKHSDYSSPDGRCSLRTTIVCNHMKAFMPMTCSLAHGDPHSQGLQSLVTSKPAAWCFTHRAAAAVVAATWLPEATIARQMSMAMEAPAAARLEHLLTPDKCLRARACMGTDGAAYPTRGLSTHLPRDYGVCPYVLDAQKLNPTGISSHQGLDDKNAATAIIRTTHLMWHASAPYLHWTQLWHMDMKHILRNPTCLCTAYNRHMRWACALQHRAVGAAHKPP